LVAHAVIAIATTADVIKLAALRSVLIDAGISSEVFDTAAGSMWGSAIPQRLMIDDADRLSARQALQSAGFVSAADGDWDLSA
jgi:hypothetical protein